GRPGGGGAGGGERAEARGAWGAAGGTAGGTALAGLGEGSGEHPPGRGEFQPGQPGAVPEALKGPSAHGVDQERVRRLRALDREELAVGGERALVGRPAVATQPLEGG